MKLLNRLSTELSSSLDQRSSWVEVLSAIYQALPQDDRLKDLEVVDPKQIPFSDRKEVYLESIETKFFKDISIWYKANKPAYDSQFDSATGDDPEGAAAAVSSVKAEAKTAAKDSESAVKGAGWVIELTGYHFHNSPDVVMKRGAGRTFVINEFLQRFFEDVNFPGTKNAAIGGGLYKFEDFGIYLPTIITQNDSVPDVISFADDETIAAAGRRGTDEDTEEVKRYDFVIQMAWVPRSPRERFEAKTKREAEETKLKEQEEKRAAAQAAAGTNNNNNS